MVLFCINATLDIRVSLIYSQFGAPAPLVQRALGDTGSDVPKQVTLSHVSAVDRNWFLPGARPVLAESRILNGPGATGAIGSLICGPPGA